MVIGALLRECVQEEDSGCWSQLEYSGYAWGSARVHSSLRATQTSASIDTSYKYLGLALMNGHASLSP